MARLARWGMVCVAMTLTGCFGSPSTPSPTEEEPAVQRPADLVSDWAVDLSPRGAGTYVASVEVWPSGQMALLDGTFTATGSGTGDAPEFLSAELMWVFGANQSLTWGIDTEVPAVFWMSPQGGQQVFVSMNGQMLVGPAGAGNPTGFDFDLSIALKECVSANGKPLRLELQVAYAAAPNNPTPMHVHADVHSSAPSFRILPTVENPNGARLVTFGHGDFEEPDSVQVHAGLDSFASTHGAFYRLQATNQTEFIGFGYARELAPGAPGPALGQLDLILSNGTADTSYSVGTGNPFLHVLGKPGQANDWTFTVDVWGMANLAIASMEFPRYGGDGPFGGCIRRLHA